ncbi:MAG: phage capsid protein [Clostridia bacterium]|nr:phage capsid protein [Clostridia bacterium]
MGFFNFIKGLVNRMLGNTEIKMALGVTPLLGDTMSERLRLWSEMYAGNAPWTDDVVKSLRLEKGIVRELANITTLEMTTSVSDTALDGIYQRALRDLSMRLQSGLAMGAMCIKPLPDLSVQYISQNAFVPIRYDSHGRLVSVVFPETIRDGDVYYIRLEWHDLTPQGLRIINRAFISHNENSLGRQTFLSVREEWANILPEVMYEGVTRPIYGYFVTPIDNTVVGSFAGVSAFDSAAELIRMADTQFGRLEWEFESGERAIHVDEAALRPKLREDGKREWSLPKLKRRLYRGLNVDVGNGELFKEYSPEFREQSLISGLEEYKRNIEFSVGLAYGDISNPATVAKTATEVLMAKKRKYDTVSAIQANLRDCLDDLVWALAFYAKKTTSRYEFICDFKDSILTDEDTERAHDERMVSMGVMSLAEFRSKWMGEPLDVAEKNLPANLAVQE